MSEIKTKETTMEPTGQELVSKGLEWETLLTKADGSKICIGRGYSRDEAVALANWWHPKAGEKTTIRHLLADDGTVKEPTPLMERKIKTAEQHLTEMARSEREVI